MLATLRTFFATLIRNPVGLLGTAITTATAVLFLTLFGLSLAGMSGGPYIGILVYLILPVIFVAGLVLIPIGLYRQRRAERAAGLAPSALLPIIDLNRSRTQKALLIFFVLTTVNVVIISVATYKGVQVMDSTAFCGATCHTVMQPEYTTYQRSPHARVACIDCHIGPGANWFVKSKLSGAWQVAAVTFDLYPRPIHTPVANLRPARETCEQCHWPSKFVGDRLRVFTEYSPDQDNTAVQTILLMHVGGTRGSGSGGIHWHVGPGVRVRYRANPDRTAINTVEVTRPDGSSELFSSGGEPAGGTWRVMDCVDCHNRPTHVFDTPEQAVDRALAHGRIPTDLPFVKREGLRIVQTAYPSEAQARVEVPAALSAFYRTNYPQLADARAPAIAQAGAALADAYAGNVFPAMKVGWNTYPNHLGHRGEQGGCFRCHDGAHTSQAGNVISQDCSLCHGLLADQEKNPTILQQLNP
jgi:hypothetical protein